MLLTMRIPAPMPAALRPMAPMGLPRQDSLIILIPERLPGAVPYQLPMVQEVQGRPTTRILVLRQPPARDRAPMARQVHPFTITAMEQPLKQPMPRIIMVRRWPAHEIQMARRLSEQAVLMEAAV